jgi:hypothetical protein
LQKILKTPDFAALLAFITRSSSSGPVHDLKKRTDPEKIAALLSPAAITPTRRAQAEASGICRSPEPAMQEAV